MIGLRVEKNKPPSLVSLCLGVVGRHLEDIVEDLSEIAVSFPADIKVKNLMIAVHPQLFVVTMNMLRFVLLQFRPFVLFELLMNQVDSYILWVMYALSFVSPGLQFDSFGQENGSLFVVELLNDMLSIHPFVRFGLMMNLLTICCLG